MPLEVNTVAPNFKLFSSDKKEIELSGMKGKHVLLLFFPLAFTSTCTKELCYMSDNLERYNKLNAQVFGISNDSIFVLAKFKAESNIQFDLLSDFNKSVSKSYDALYDEFIYNMKGVSKRAAFIIDKNGIIQYEEVLENASDEPSYDKIYSILESLTC